MMTENALTLIQGKTTMIIEPEVIDYEKVLEIERKLTYDLSNIDVTNNTPAKLITINEVVGNISKELNIKFDETILVGDYYEPYPIYKKIKDFGDALHLHNEALSDNKEALSNIFNTICKQWGQLLITLQQDICKETISMILDAREGFDFFFINKK